MALSFGKVSGALAAVHNENTAALINLNADFTLVKLEAPAEYSALGNTISKKRKVDAEEGTLHKTARRLGALFKDVLPTTEELCRAYGTRVSEICSMLATTPSREHDGIFGSHLGLDTTSIWAAATSGSAAIQVHLLACMLARIFSVQEAISLWVELVEKRKTCIRIKQSNVLYSSDHQNEILASQQDISRSDLAIWDSSARAWLQSADQAKQRQHIQTMLILNNASVPVNSEPQTYNSVMKAWTTALEGMNDLIKGIPQRIQDGAALLAVSSWHLYPDMVVHDNSYAEVRQQDALFQTGAILTLGLQQVRKDTKSVYWSLPLARLQFYGHPVRAVRTIGDNKRITCDQFGYVVLGCLFKGWKEFAVNDEDGLERLGRITNVMDLPRNSRFKHSEVQTWLIYLAVAAQNYIDCEDEERVVAQQLLKLGRRYPGFLDSTFNSPPMFGLSTLSGLFRVLDGFDDQKLNCLRKLSSRLGYSSADFIIHCHPQNGVSTYVEYASVAPTSPNSLPKRTLDGDFKTTEMGPAKNFRWIVASEYQLMLFVQYCEDFKDIEAAKLRLLLLNQTSQPVKSALKNILNEDIDTIKAIQELTEVIVFAERCRHIESVGEIFLPVKEKLGFDSGTELCFPTSMDFVEASRELLATSFHSPQSRTLMYRFYAGIPGQCALYSMSEAHSELPREIHLEPTFVDEFFQPAKVDQFSLKQHLGSAGLLVNPVIQNLRACAMMSEVYHLLPGAEITTNFLKTSLTVTKWAKEATTENMHGSGLTLSQAFACIAMFDSGTCNLDPDSLSQVFALSSGNSLYIAATLLCDPIEKPGTAEIRRVVGNVGRSGMTFLISPPDVKTREADPEQWMSINHTPFDGEPESHFGNTSIHLSFTNYEIPLVPDDNHQHIIDRIFVLVETLVSVYDGPTWVGEVDMLKTFAGRDICRVQNPVCSNVEKAVSYEAVVREFPRLAATSIENWDELIEAPTSGTIAVKSHKNWLARLAITAMAVQHGFTPLVLSEDVCWTCCSRAFPKRKEIKFPGSKETYFFEREKKYALIW